MLFQFPLELMARFADLVVNNELDFVGLLFDPVL